MGYEVTRRKDSESYLKSRTKTRQVSYPIDPFTNNDVSVHIINTKFIWKTHTHVKYLKEETTIQRKEILPWPGDGGWLSDRARS